ncbi:MAG: transcription antitermination factor NusB [Desulfobacterales bacterium]
MGARRKAREAALQALFFMDHGGRFTPEALARFRADFAPKPEALPHFERLVRGVLRTRGVLDRLIERYSENWSLERMGGVDRNVMRIALYEMLWCADIPHRVAIDEAVEIGKKYGGEESGAFINGIVDRVRLALERGEVEPPGPEEASGIGPEDNGAPPAGGEAAPEERPRETAAAPAVEPAAAEGAVKPRRRYVRGGGSPKGKKTDATGGRR